MAETSCSQSLVSESATNVYAQVQFASYHSNMPAANKDETASEHLRHATGPSA